MISDKLTFYFKKSDAIAAASNTPNAIIIAKDAISTGHEGAKRFAVINAAELLEHYRTNDGKNEHLYSCNDSVAMPHIKHKFFMDIDISADEVGSEIFDSLLPHAEKIPEFAHRWISQKFSGIWKAILPTPIIYGSLDQKTFKMTNKISFHLIYQVRFDAFLHIRHAIVEWIHEQLDNKPEWFPFTSWTFQNSSGKTKHIIDPTVYGKNLFRLPYQSKQYKNTVLLHRGCNGLSRCFYTPAGHIIHGWSHWITDPADTVPVFEYSDDVARMLTVVKDSRPVADSVHVPEGYMVDVETLKTIRDPFLRCLHCISKNMNRNIQHHIFAAHKSYVADGNNGCDKMAVIGHFITDEFITKFGYDGCVDYMSIEYDSSVSNATMLFMAKLASRFYPSFSIYPSISSQDIINNHISIVDPDVEYTDRYVKDLPNDRDIILMSPMGSGKSTSVRRMISGLDPTSRILFITCRRTLSFDIMAQYREHGFTHYDTMTSESQKRLIIQIESLRRVTTSQPYDYVILDESESLLSQCYASTQFDIIDNAIKFYELCQKSRYVIAMDAFISKRTHMFMNELRIDKVRTFIKYSKNYTDRRTVIFQTKPRLNNSAMINELMKDLSANKNIFVFSSSLRGLHKLRTLIMNHVETENLSDYDGKILTISSEMSNSEKRSIFNDVNGTFQTYKVILCSPTVTVGVNFDLHHFDTCFVFITNSSCCVRDCLQASLRTRHLRDSFVFFQIETSPYFNTMDRTITNESFLNSLHRNIYEDVHSELELSHQNGFEYLKGLLEYGGFPYETPEVYEYESAKEIVNVQLPRAELAYTFDINETYDQTQVDSALLNLSDRNETNEERLLILKYRFYKIIRTCKSRFILGQNPEIRYDIDAINRMFNTFCISTVFNYMLQGSFIVYENHIVDVNCVNPNAHTCVYIRMRLLRIFQDYPLIDAALKDADQLAEITSKMMILNRQIGLVIRTDHRESKTLSIKQILHSLERMNEIFHSGITISSVVKRKRCGETRLRFYEHVLNDEYKDLYDDDRNIYSDSLTSLDKMKMIYHRNRFVKHIINGSLKSIPRRNRETVANDEPISHQPQKETFGQQIYREWLCGFLLRQQQNETQK